MAAPAVTKNRRDSVDNAISQIHRQFGKGSIMRLGAHETEPIPVIPTGCLSLDIALGVGGFPRGRISEIYGPESSGKTTLALHVIAEAQKRGGSAAFIDAEHALDTGYAEPPGRGYRQSAGLPAGFRRTGPGDRRDPDPLAAASMSLSSTPWPPWCPRPRSTAMSAILMSASRHG